MSNFTDKRKSQLGIKSLGDMIKSGEVSTDIDPSLFVHGPEEFDCLVDKWARGEVLGVIGGSGAGKTQIFMDIAYNMLKNSPDSDSIVIFVSLEMKTSKIAQRWIKLVGRDSELADRFYVVSNYREDGSSRMMNTEDILEEALRIKAFLEVEVLTVCVDHLHVVESSPHQGKDINKIAFRFKELAVEIDTLLVLLSQTTKGKSGSYCDRALDADASFNCSQFKWAASWVICVHQPLNSVVAEAKLHCLAWSYRKIREKNEDDKVVEGVYNLLHYHMETGRLRPLTINEMITFSTFYSVVLERKKDEDEEGDFASYNTKIDGKAISDRDKLLHVQE